MKESKYDFYGECNNSKIFSFMRNNLGWYTPVEHRLCKKQVGSQGTLDRLLSGQFKKIK